MALFLTEISQNMLHNAIHIRAFSILKIVPGVTPGAPLLDEGRGLDAQHKMSP